MKTNSPGDLLLQLLQQTFGTTVELVEQKLCNQQQDYLVLHVQLRHPSIHLVIKLAGPQALMAGSFDRTAMLNRLVANCTSIPMPEILAVNMSYQSWPWRYLIRTYIPGQEWKAAQGEMNDEELSDAYQQIGIAVAQLHRIDFPSFGELAVDGSVIGDEPFLAAFTARAQRSIKSSQLYDLFFSTVDKHKDMFMDIHQACLCHEDLHKHNILFEYKKGHWHLATILDFDKAWAGHSEIDLARMQFWKGMVSNEFWRSYQSICPLESAYEQRRFIYQLLWCFEFAQNTPAHLRDTQYLCAKLGIPDVRRFD